MQQIKTMPANIEAEKALLGCILLDENLMVEAIDSLSVDDFYDSRNKVIFSAMSNLKDNNLKIDITTLLSELEKNNKLELAGGYPYLGSLADYGYSISNFESYIDLIQNSALRRETINVLGRLQQEGFDLNVNTFDYVENVERDVFQLSRRRRVDGFSTIKEVSERVIKQTEKASKNKELLVGLTTGFHSLDNITLGFQSHQLIILAARPGMGKSALALNLAVNIATKNKGGNASVAIFNLEMSGEQLAMRMLAADSKIGLKQIQTGALQQAEWVRLSTSFAKLSRLNIYFDDAVDLTVSKIRAKCRKQKAEKGLDFVIIDYLQLLEADGRYASDQEKVAKISRGLKMMALELQVPVLALSQLSRSVEKREDQRPVMADLRSSGAIEQDADVIMFIYRDDKAHEELKKGEASISIAKNRSGSTNEGLPFFFNGPCTCFEEKIE